jgi:tRNA(Ile2) C34 agmatinyltransferase TiaS
MPDRITIEAATPKCPKCSKLLTYSASKRGWRCRAHGLMVSARSLVTGYF